MIKNLKSMNTPPPPCPPKKKFIQTSPIALVQSKAGNKYEKT